MNDQSDKPLQDNDEQFRPEQVTAEGEFQLEQPASEGPLDFTKAKPQPELSQPYSWQASEGVNRERPISWYVVFVLIMLVLMAVAIFYFKNITFAILIPVMTTASFILLKKSPRMVNYSISPKGVYVGDHLHDFSEFKSFGVVVESEQPYIILFPIKRFGFGATLHFNEQDGEKIVDLLGARIPMQEVKLDMFEKFIRWAKL